MNKPRQNTPRQRRKSDDLFQGLLRAAALSSRQSIKPRMATGPVPLSAAQQQMWFLHQLAPQSPAYNTFRAYYLSGRLHLPTLKACLREIVRRHDALRTVFTVIDGVPFQVVQPHMDPEFSYKDLTGVPGSHSPVSEGGETFSPPSIPAEVEELMAAEAMKIFSFPQGPCLRVALFETGADAYYFLLAMPHIVCDGWSLSVFFRELAALYEAFSAGQAPSPEKPPVQFSDYALWQRDWVESHAPNSHFAYWQQQLEGHSKLLDLPADYPRPATLSFQGACEPFSLTKSLSDALKALSAREGVTPFMTLLAAFQALLFRYSGQADIVVGSPIANRNHPEIQGLIGCFINTLALRTDLSGNPGFRQLLARVKKMTLDAFAHQDLPFQKLLEKLRVERNQAFSPLFQIAFVLQNTPDLTLRFSGLTFSPVTIDNKTAKYDLTLVLEDTSGGLAGKVEYATDLFKSATVLRLIGHFRTLLAGIVENPDCPISEVALLTEPERNLLLVEWNDTKCHYPNDQCIHQLFESHAERTPDAVAVVHKGEQLTYGELNRRSNQLARYLIKLGAGPESKVGISIGRSLEMVIGVLGILKAGAAYLPLDPSYPEDRLAFMMEDCATEILLTQKGVLEAFPGDKAQVVRLDEDWDDISRERVENVACDVGPHSLAYVMFTSGSTGRPKGVEIPHRGVVRLVCGQDYVSFNAEQRFLLLAPISFDASTFELWGALLHGGCCVVYPDRYPSVAGLGEVIANNAISTLWLTSSLFNTIVDEAPEILAPIRQLLTGGEPLSASHVQRARDILPQVKLTNGYGPTENTTFTCCYALSEKKGDFSASVPIGKPIANTEVYILDGSLQPVPVGIAGELYVGGAGLARGYLNRPELTRERFIPHPFSQKKGSCLYKTGDLARFRADGNIDFLGRIDSQVKIRGYRVEPGEIESVLKCHPLIRDSAVVACKDELGGARLAAYVACRKPKPSSEDLRNALHQQLPDYMLPALFIFLEKMPLSPNGKVDRHALPPPVVNKKEQEYAPLTHDAPLEEAIRKIWQEVLHLDAVGLHDSFFELGGHSLLAIQLIAWIRRELRVELSIREVFDNPTIAALAEIIADAHPGLFDKEECE